MYLLVPVIVMPVLIKTSHLSETKKKKKKKYLKTNCQRAKYAIRPSRRAIRYNDIDRRARVERSVVETANRYVVDTTWRACIVKPKTVHTHARTFATFAYARAFTPILQRPRAHPRYSLVPTLYVVYVHTYVRLCVRARTAGGIHHCATNFRDKYFTDGHYAEIRVFARYKLWMWLRWRLHRPRGGQIVSTKGHGTRGDAIGCKGKSLMPVKFIHS